MHVLKRPLARTAIFLSTLLLISLGLGTWNALRPIEAVAATAVVANKSTLDVAALRWPAQGEAAVGALGYGVLATNGAQKPLPTASIAKVITSLAVLERLPLKAGESGPLFTISAADVAIYNDYVARDGSVLAVQQGEQLNEYQLLQALMLPSANNIADSLTTWVFGSYTAYATYANDMVKRLGMTNTTVAGDASGLSPLTTSTAQDLILLGQAALNHPVLADIVSQTTAVLPVAGTVHNVNWLLGTDGVIGVKTGNSDEAGGCLLLAATHQVAPGKTIKVITAVMGTADLTSALTSSLPLINSAKTNFTLTTPIHAGQTIATYTLPWGDTATAIASSDISFVNWSTTAVATTTKLDTLNHAVTKGHKLGTITVTAGSQHQTAPLIAKQTTAGPNLWWRATRH